MKENDLRRYSRVPVYRPGRIRVADGPETNTQLMDISEVGAMLFYSSPVALGTPLELRFYLNTGEKTLCITYGQVRHYTPRGESHVIGTEFTHFDPETLNAR